MAHPGRGHRAAAALLSALALAGCGGGPEERSGFLVDDGTVVRLCEALAESYPPQCAGDSVAVQGELPQVDWTEAHGVRWTDRTVTLRGEVADGVLRLNRLDD